jgi:predicted transcriptional regulator
MVVTAIELKVSDYMTKGPITADSSIAFPSAVGIMASKGIGNLIVLQNEKPIGLLTEREILQYLVLNRKVPAKPIKDIIKRSFASIKLDTGILEAARIMVSKKARLLVFDDGELVGIITASDLVRAFRKTGKNPALDNVMTMKIFSIAHDDTIFAAIKLMHERRIGGVIVNKNNTPFGIFTERDLLTNVLAKHVDLEENVGGCCSSPLISTLIGIGASDAASIMSANNIKRLPIRKDGKLVAIVTARDLVEAFQKDES